MSGAWRWRLPLRARAHDALPAWMESSVNFLPYRRVRALRQRHRRRIQLALAACVGLLSALALGEAQRIHAARADARSGALKSSLSQMEPALAESAALQRALQARLRRVALIDELAVKRDEAFHLLTALGTHRRQASRSPSCTTVRGVPAFRGARAGSMRWPPGSRGLSGLPRSTRLRSPISSAARRVRSWRQQQQLRQQWTRQWIFPSRFGSMGPSYGRPRPLPQLSRGAL
jgi:Tfp pilus assembly protein PilN